MLEFVLALLAIFLFWKLLPLILVVLMWTIAFVGTGLILGYHKLFGKNQQ